MATALAARYRAAMSRTLVFVLSLLLLPACAILRQETNDPIDAVVIGSLQPGTTTAREVVEKLGAPTEVVQLGRRTAYRYDASCTKGAGLILILFNMFAQAATRGPWNTGGFGVGLAICKYVAEHHGGSLTLESQHGKGSLFRFRLPRTRPDGCSR